MLTPENMTGIFTGSALPGLVGTFFSARQGALAIISSIWGGFAVAVIVWITIAQRLSGEVSITSVGAIDPCLYGCVAGIGASTLITITISVFQNARYDWGTLKAVRLIGENGEEYDVAKDDPTYDAERLRRAAYWARGVTLFLFLALFIIWPLSMYGSGYVFSKSFFRGWIIVSLLWAFGAIFAVSVLPIIEGRRTLVDIARKATQLVRRKSSGQSKAEGRGQTSEFSTESPADESGTDLKSTL
jgi:hypothetical protein